MIYSFECEKCGHKFEMSVDMDKIVGYRPKCTNCKSFRTFRDYQADNVQLTPPTRTLGSFVDKKKKFSDEAKDKILKNNRDQNQKRTELPNGAKRYERDSDGRIKPFDT
jgi:hypothetical protein